MINAPMDRAFILTHLEQFEGRIPHMYRCTGGEVTVGIGHAIPSADDAVQLTWIVGGRAATSDEVRAGWAAVEAAQLGLVAGAYAPLSPCRMANEAIDSLAGTDVDRFAGQIAAALPKWTSEIDTDTLGTLGADTKKYGLIDEEPNLDDLINQSG